MTIVGSKTLKVVLKSVYDSLVNLSTTSLMYYDSLVNQYYEFFGKSQYYSEMMIKDTSLWTTARKTYFFIETLSAVSLLIFFFFSEKASYLVQTKEQWEIVIIIE